MDIMSYLLGQQAGGASKGLKVEVVEELPEIGEANILYLVPKQDTGDNDVFDEWLYIEDEWEHIGTTDIDLSNYYTKDEVYNKTQIDAKVPINAQKIISNRQFNYSGTAEYEDISELSNLNEGIYYIYTKQMNTTNVLFSAILIVSTKSGTQNRQTQTLFCWRPTGQYLSEVFVSFRPIVNGQSTYGSNFSNYQMTLNYEGVGNTIPASSSYSTWKNLVMGQNIYNWYGSKKKSDLNTTNKDSLVDAINEVNTKINNLVDANNTSY